MNTPDWADTEAERLTSSTREAIADALRAARKRGQRLAPSLHINHGHTRPPGLHPGPHNTPPVPHWSVLHMTLT